MSKKLQDQDPDELETAHTLSAVASEYLAHYLPDRDAEPYRLTDITNQLGITAPRMKASELVDQEFTILAAKTFGSSFDAERHAYYCIIRKTEDQQLYSTVLGGFAVTDILDAICSTDFRKPLLCTLRENRGGRYGRYYTLE